MNTMMWVCAALSIVIFGTILHSVATFRTQPTPASTYKRTTIIEVVWALIPILIVIAAALPSFQESASTDVTVAASE